MKGAGSAKCEPYRSAQAVPNKSDTVGGMGVYRAKGSVGSGMERDGSGLI